MSLATKSCDAWKQVGEEASKFVREWLCSQGDEAVVGLGAQARHAYRHECRLAWKAQKKAA